MRNHSRPIILATVGPSSLAESTIRHMDAAGVDIFRINLSHTALADLPEVTRRLQGWTKKTVCFDTEGAQIRTGRLPGGPVSLHRYQEIRLSNASEPTTPGDLPLYPIDPVRDLQIGDTLFIDFHGAIVQVVGHADGKAIARVLTEGKVGHNKAVSSTSPVPLPAFTPKDRSAIAVARELNVRSFAFSFAADAADVRWLREQFDEPIEVICKIESRAGLRGLAPILSAADAILIDRGDLSKEVAVEKIGIAQRFIMAQAADVGRPVYVATNLLETMIETIIPSRAEINDVTSTVLAGASGLVLAAETAIGRHPVEAVRMVGQIVGEALALGRAEGAVLDRLMQNDHPGLAAPHGGRLVESYAAELPHDPAVPVLPLDECQAMDFLQIAQGTFSPIDGFFDLAGIMSVLHTRRLPSGVVWTLPIVCAVRDPSLRRRLQALPPGTPVPVHGPAGERLGVLMLNAVESMPLRDVVVEWFGTADPAHPGVRRALDDGEWIVSGTVVADARLRNRNPARVLSPSQSRDLFSQRGWQRIVGFHTRNVSHLGHEFIQREAVALAEAQVLFISPVIGPRRAGDFAAEAVLRTYAASVAAGTFAPAEVVLGAFATYPRYAGPREAVFTALCRKNLGCTHFVVGRDHTGLGTYFAPTASQDAFQEVGDIGITPLFFDTSYYCLECQAVRTSCSHDVPHRRELSGTRIREFVSQRARVPATLVNPVVADVLEAMVRRGESVLV